MKKKIDITHKNKKESPSPANRRKSAKVVPQKAAEEKLRESEERFHLLSEAAEEGIAIHDKGVIIEANQALAKMFGYKLSEMIGIYAEKLATPESWEVVLKYIAKGVDKPYEGVGVRKDGSTFICSLVGKPYKYKGRSLRLAVFRDNTERKRTEEKYRNILENIQEGYFEVDLAGNYTFLNDSMCRIHGYPKEELMGMNNRQYTEKEVAKKVFQAFNAVFKTGKPLEEIDWQITRKNGEKRYIEASVSLRKDSSGKPIGFRGIIRDVTEGKKADETLSIIKKAVESSSDAIGLSDPEGNHFYHNEAFTELFGYTPEELRALGGGSVIYTNKDTSKIVFDTIMKGGSWIGETEFVSKGGDKFLAMLRADAIKDDSGKVIGLIGLHTDITERKKAEDLLRQSEEKYRLLADHMKDQVWLMDMNMNIIYASPSVEKITGYSSDEIKKLKLEELLTPESLQKAIDFISINMPKAIKSSSNDFLFRTLELEFILKGGQTIWGECSFNFIRDESGKPVSILGEARDITERKQVEYELRASESNFRHSLDDSPLGVRISTIEGETIYANRAILNIYGYDSIEELKNKRIKQRYTPESYAEWQARKKKRLAGESGTSEYEISIVRKNGEIRHLHVFRKEIFWDGKKQSQVIYQDITEHRQSEVKIYQSEEKYRTILENIEDGYYEVDLAGNFTFFNDSMCRILGYNKEEMMGINNRQYTDKENSKKLFQAFNEVYKTGKAARGFDWQITRKDGTKRYIEASVSLLKDSSGKHTGFRGIVSDITERKMAEEKLQKTLESLKRAVGTTIQVLVSMLESRDPYTAGHQSRVADIARAIATEIGLANEIIEGIRVAGSIHDIGKISIPGEILSKPTKLTDIEFSLVKEHPQSGYEMLKNVESPWPLAQIVQQHHERIDGSGYPNKLKGDEIIIEARIMAVADVVEAMSSHRPYRASLGIDSALEEIEKNKGILYDDTVADACLRLFREKGYQLK